ncbi:MAG TPA: hypothetical protein VHS35_06570 [Pseudonocardia sp.]|nr:hypothetical protein [Pseudonocardia sp.]
MDGAAIEPLSASAPEASDAETAAPPAASEPAEDLPMPALRMSTTTVDSASELSPGSSVRDPAPSSEPDFVTLGDEDPPDGVEGPSAPDGRAAEPDGCTAGMTTVC